MSLTKVSHSMLSGGKVNVDDYGADPTGVEDSTTAIQAAVAYAESLVEAAVDGVGDNVNGATVTFHGVYKVTNPIRVSASNVCLEGQGGTTIYPYFDDDTGYNGAKPVFIIGTAEDWQNAGSISGTSKYNRVSGINIKRVTGYDTFIGYLFSGTRNASFKNCLIERGFAGALLENTSEFYGEQISTIGCTYGLILDSRSSRAAEDSVLNVENGNNDVSASTFSQFTSYYPQHTGIMMVNTGNVSFNGATIGQFSDNPLSSSILGLPTDYAGIHIWGSDSFWTRSAMFNDIVFEAISGESHSCYRVESTTQNNPITGVTINNSHVQTYASDPENNLMTILVSAVQSGDGDVHNVVVRDSGFTYQSDGYYTGQMCNVTGTAGILFDNCYPASAFNLSNIGIKGVVEDWEVYEHVDVDAFPPTGWAAAGTTTGCSQVGGSSGVEPYLEFTGDTGEIYVYKSFDYLQDTNQVKQAFISFLGYGDGELYCVSRVNAQADTDSDIVDATNISRYGQAIWPNNVNTSGYRRIIFCFNPFTASYAFNTVRFSIGKGSTDTTSEYVRIKDIRVGYFVGSAVPYNPFS